MKLRASPRRVLWTTICLCAVVFAIAVVSLALGPVRLSIGEVWTSLVNPGRLSPESPAAVIVREARLPRVLLAGLVGLSLSIAGVAFQGLLRNPLADPYIIGVSSGAAFGASLVIVAGLGGLLYGLGVPIAGFVVALAVLSLVIAISRRGGKIPVETFLLAGVVVGSFMWALVSGVIMLSDRSMHQVIFWLMGSFATAEMRSVLLVLPFAVVGFIGLAWMSRDLNALALGEEDAHHLGVNVEAAKKKMIGLGALVTAACVSFSGIIGFVGLVIPHICRLVFGPDARILIPTSALIGAAFLILADTVARSAFGAIEVPVGLITALVGAPFFCILLMRRKRAVFR